MNERDQNEDRQSRAEEDDVAGQERIIGRLEAQQSALDERMERIETKVDVLLEYMQQRKGGARVIWAIAGAGGLIGASLTKLGAMAVAAIRGP